MNKKLFNLLILLCLVGGVYSIVFTSNKLFQGYSSFLTTSSPKATYTVNLTGEKGRPVFFTNQVNFNVKKNGKTFVLNQPLHSGDSFDSSFESAYPNYNWIDENVMIFYSKKKFNIDDNDTLIIKNNTDKKIKYTKVYSSEDKFLLFDIQPQSEIKLSTSSSKGNYPGIYIMGEFYNEKKFENGSGFVINKGLKGPFIYYLNINNEEINIKNPKLEKYRSPN